MGRIHLSGRLGRLGANEISLTCLGVEHEIISSLQIVFNEVFFFHSLLCKSGKFRTFQDFDIFENLGRMTSQSDLLMGIRTVVKMTISMENIAGYPSKAVTGIGL